MLKFCGNPFEALDSLSVLKVFLSNWYTPECFGLYWLKDEREIRVERFSIDFSGNMTKIVYDFFFLGKWEIIFPIKYLVFF